MSFLLNFIKFYSFGFYDLFVVYIVYGKSKTDSFHYMFHFYNIDAWKEHIMLFVFHSG